MQPDPYSQQENPSKLSVALEYRYLLVVVLPCCHRLASFATRYQLETYIVYIHLLTTSTVAKESNECLAWRKGSRRLGNQAVVSEWGRGVGREGASDATSTVTLSRGWQYHVMWLKWPRRLLFPFTEKST
jgi:hypothetical protein